MDNGYGIINAEKRKRLMEEWMWEVEFCLREYFMEGTDFEIYYDAEDNGGNGAISRRARHCPSGIRMDYPCEVVLGSGANMHHYDGIEDRNLEEAAQRYVENRADRDWELQIAAADEATKEVCNG